MRKSRSLLTLSLKLRKGSRSKQVLKSKRTAITYLKKYIIYLNFYTLKKQFYIIINILINFKKNNNMWKVNISYLLLTRARPLERPRPIEGAAELLQSEKIKNLLIKPIMTPEEC